MTYSLFFRQKGATALLSLFAIEIGPSVSATPANHLTLKAAYKIAPSFYTAFTRVSKKTGVPVVLPTNIPGKFYCYIDALTQNEYEIDLDLTPDCHGAEACSFGSIGGKKASSPASYGTSNYSLNKGEGQPIVLAHGIKGYYSPQGLSAGLVFWNQGGYSYVAAWKASKTQVIQMANSAILNEK